MSHSVQFPRALNLALDVVIAMSMAYWWTRGKLHRKKSNLPKAKVIS